MRFRKYSPELKFYIVFNILLITFLLPFSIHFTIKTSDYRVLFFFGLPMIIYVIAFSWSSLKYMLRSDKANISDMIVLDEEGIKLECENGQKTVILWENIIKIERRNNFRMFRSIHVMSKSGEEIWWYTDSKKAKEYILKQHPELTKIYTEKK